MGGAKFINITSKGPTCCSITRYLMFQEDFAENEVEWVWNVEIISEFLAPDIQHAYSDISQGVKVEIFLAGDIQHAYSDVLQGVKVEIISEFLAPDTQHAYCDILQGVKEGIIHSSHVSMDGVVISVSAVPHHSHTYHLAARDTSRTPLMAPVILCRCVHCGQLSFNNCKWPS